MRRHPSWWNNLLAQLGFRRRRIKEYGPYRSHRQPRIESLEARQLMTVTVDTLADVVDGNDGVTSLREAIASAPSSGNTVDFHASLTQGVITLNSQLSLTQPITINGLGADKLTVAAGGNHRVFQVSSGVAATLNGMKITGGNLVNASEEGAGIFNSGTLTLNSVEVSGNTTVGIGGGITSRNYSGTGQTPSTSTIRRSRITMPSKEAALRPTWGEEYWRSVEVPSPIMFPRFR